MKWVSHEYTDAGMRRFVTRQGSSVVCVYCCVYRCTGIYVERSLVLSSFLLYSMHVLGRLRVGDRVCVTSLSCAQTSKDEGGFLRYWGKVKKKYYSYFNTIVFNTLYVRTAAARIVYKDYYE